MGTKDCEFSGVLFGVIPCQLSFNNATIDEKTLGSPMGVIVLLMSRSPRSNQL